MAESLGAPILRAEGNAEYGILFFFLIFIYLAMPSYSASTWDL